MYVWDLFAVRMLHGFHTGKEQNTKNTKHKDEDTQNIEMRNFLLLLGFFFMADWLYELDFQNARASDKNRTFLWAQEYSVCVCWLQHI